jgi:hypothetical protein
MMARCFSEPTIDDLLGDTLTQGLMRADGVDVSALKTMLLGLASVIERRPSVQHDRYIPTGGAWARNETGIRGGQPLIAVADDAGTACPL